MSRLEPVVQRMVRTYVVGQVSNNPTYSSTCVIWLYGPRGNLPHVGQIDHDLPDPLIDDPDQWVGKNVPSTYDICGRV